MSYLNDEQFEERANHEDNLVVRLDRSSKKVQIVKLHRGGHPTGHHDYTNEQRANLVKMSRVFGNKTTSEMSGVPKSRISVYTKGQKTQGVPDKELRELVNDQLTPIREAAAALVLQTLGVITSEEIGKEKLRDRVAIARDLSVIVDRSKPLIDDDRRNVTANVIFYAPRVRDLKEYEQVG